MWPQPEEFGRACRTLHEIDVAETGRQSFSAPFHHLENRRISSVPLQGSRNRPWAASPTTGLGDGHHLVRHAKGPRGFGYVRRLTRFPRPEGQGLKSSEWQLPRLMGCRAPGRKIFGSRAFNAVPRAMIRGAVYCDNERMEFLRTPRASRPVSLKHSKTPTQGTSGDRGNNTPEFS